MKLNGLKIFSIGFLLLGFSSASWAIPYANPNPGVFGDDFDGSGLFTHSDITVSVEAFDLVSTTSGGITGAQFGFYYGADPGTLIPIFDFDDNPPPAPQTAAISFSAGAVVDIDAGNVVQSTFDNSLGLAPIGFYLQIPAQIPLFTQAVLNPGGVDVAGVFPVLGLAQTSAIYFYANVGGTPVPIGIEIVTPVSPVPLPGAAGLWLLGLAGLALFRRTCARLRGRERPTGDLVPCQA